MGQNNNSKPASVSIGLVNPKSPSNVAVVLRAAGCFDVSCINYTGKRYTQAKAFYEDTKKVRHDIPVNTVEDLIASAPNEATLVAVELTQGAMPLPLFNHPDNAYYIFGPEDGSIPQGIIDACQHVVYIPTRTSLNLAVTANLVLYDRLAKSNFDHSDELIKQSRDVNNQTKINTN